MSAKSLTRKIGTEVRKQRLELGLTQSQLSKLTGVSERLIRSLEAGEASGIGLDKLVSVLDALDLELDILGKTQTQNKAAQDDEYTNLLKEVVASWEWGTTND